jgi:hypothetical protein
MSRADAAAGFPAPSVAGRAGFSPLVAQAIMLGLACAAAAAGTLATNSGASAHAVAQAGPDLTRLLRAMAVMKAVIAGGACAAVLWRLQTPVPAWRFSLYAAAVAGMAAGPALIWAMVHVASGALLLHAGLIAGVALLWVDPEVTHRLKLLVARKRAAPRT